MESLLLTIIHRENIMKEKRLTKLIRELREAKNGFLDQVLENQKLVEGILTALNQALEAKDPYTQGHSKRVSMVARDIAVHMGLSAVKCERVRLAGLFHDIGKIGIPDAILFKNGPLTEKEFSEIRNHPYYSVKILESVDPFHKLLPGILHHHENWDGSGYPEGLSGERIPLAASIIHVADSYDAMTSDRAYRKCMTPAEAVMELNRRSGTYYDPKVVKHFTELFNNMEYNREIIMNSVIQCV